jgi:hypothetical protein
MPATCCLAPEDRRADAFRERERPDEEDDFDAAIVACLLLESYPASLDDRSRASVSISDQLAD